MEVNHEREYYVALKCPGKSDMKPYDIKVTNVLANTADEAVDAVVTRFQLVRSTVWSITVWDWVEVRQHGV